jgi:hypothetical protein
MIPEREMRSYFYVGKCWNVYLVENHLISVVRKNVIYGAGRVLETDNNSNWLAYFLKPLFLFPTYRSLVSDL